MLPSASPLIGARTASPSTWRSCAACWPTTTSRCKGRYYTVDGGLLARQPALPLWVAGNGPRMLTLTARYADGWDGTTGLRGDGEAFRAKLHEFRQIRQSKRSLDLLRCSDRSNFRESLD
jgi:alkanesulfonate monooxygenase SsuD/methylene tetrahydromethanopterin reductase-like flavin-dependent oxidoreductase (luciferase family)